LSCRYNADNPVEKFFNQGSSGDVPKKTVNDFSAWSLIMTTINVIRYADGRTYYNCQNPSRPPTNPKAGTTTSGNTLIWNGRTRETTLIVPRQNPVDVNQWTPSSSPFSQPTTNEVLPYLAHSKNSVVTAQHALNSVSQKKQAGLCDPIPPTAKPGKIPDLPSSSVRYPNQSTVTYPRPFR
jgi:hypothetical protein